MNSSNFKRNVDDETGFISCVFIYKKICDLYPPATVYYYYRVPPPTKRPTPTISLKEKNIWVPFYLEPTWLQIFLPILLSARERDAYRVIDDDDDDDYETL